MPRFMLLAAATLLTVAPLRPADADIAKLGSPGGQPVTVGSNLQATCWQQGIKVIEEGGLEGVNVGSLLATNAVNFKRPDQGGAAVMIVPVATAVCLITAR